MGFLADLMDLAITDDEKNGLMAHKADCAYARALATLGMPVITMFGCKGELPPDIRRHICLCPPKITIPRS